MKIIFFLLSVVFVSCVTANNGKRDLSGVNPQPEHLLNTDSKEIKQQPIVFLWDYFFGKPESKKDNTYKINNCYKRCRESDFPCDYQVAKCNRGCYNRYYSEKEGVKVASIEDQTPFNLLEESQNDFEHLSTSQDKNHKDKAPLMLAEDYDCCVKGCISDGGSSSQCHRVCEE